MGMHQGWALAPSLGACCPLVFSFTEAIKLFLHDLLPLVANLVFGILSL